MSWGRALTDEERSRLEERLAALRLEHRDLDDVIGRLEAQPLHDELQLRRMKRRKLLLKDQIAWIERTLDPDELA